MTFLASWILAPAVWLLFSAGLGLLLQRVVSGHLPTSLVAPVGFATLIMLTTFTTAWPLTSGLTMPAAVVGALLGWYLQRDRLRWSREAAFAGLAAALTFVLYGLPTMVSGSPFAGWIKLDDGSTWLAFADRIIDTGRTVEGLEPSTYEAVLQINWDGAYPVGVFPPLGGVAALLHVDSAFLLQPYMAFMAGLLALVIYSALRQDVTSRGLRTVLVVVAATPALLLGYSLWGGIKELALASILALVALLAGRRYSAAALAVVSAAVLAVSGFSGAAWLVIPGLFWLVVTLRRRQWRSLAVASAGLIGLSIPLFVLVRPEDVANLTGFATSNDDIGNLFGPLRFLQIMGIWPVGDFRVSPDDMVAVSVLLGLVAALAAVGIWSAVRRRDWFLPLYVANALILSGISHFGNAWIAGKSLAMSSPAILVAAAAGIGWLWDRRLKAIAAASAALVVGGVAWSYVLAYQEVWLAPAGQLEDLRAIGERTDHPAPALMLDYSPYGTRHFLTGLDVEGAGELRRHTIPKVAGGSVEKAEYADIDDLDKDGFARYQTLVLRTSVIGSRPPSNYSLVAEEGAYQVWRRNPDAAVVEEHVGLGTHEDPASVVACETVVDLAARHPDSRIAAVERPPVVKVELPQSEVSSTPFVVPEDGEYYLSLGGSFPGRLTLRIDDEVVYEGRHQLNWTGNVMPAGTVDLTAGRHTVSVEHERSPWQPGSRGGMWQLGPLYLSQSTADAPVIRVPADEAEQLCGRRLDWIEAVR